MNPEWQDFLQARGVPSGPATASDSVADGASDLALLVDLSHLGLIRVQGAEIDEFLQGQLTNDVRELSEQHTQLSGHCSPKGRLLANFRVMRLADGIYLQLPAERLAETIKRLRLFVLRARVTLDDLSDELARFGVAGTQVADQLAALGLRVPGPDGELAETDGVYLLGLPGPVPRFEAIGAPAALMPLWDALAATAKPASADIWALFDIQAGIPTVYNATADTFVPQMINMQLIDGISFSKGCYIGQEVVARMQYLGKLKRRMYLAEVESDLLPAPGDALHAPASTSEQASGWVVDARSMAPGHHQMLAVVEIDAAEGGEVHLGADGPLLRLAPPPYGFPVA